MDIDNKIIEKWYFDKEGELLKDKQYAIDSSEIEYIITLVHTGINGFDSKTHTINLSNNTIFNKFDYCILQYCSFNFYYNGPKNSSIFNKLMKQILTRGV